MTITSRSELELNESMSMYLATGRDQEVQQVQKGKVHFLNFNHILFQFEMTFTEN